MSDEDFIHKLQKRMLGKVVASIELVRVPESVCQFTMNDGSVFRLHATDLGAWVEDTVAAGVEYTSLDHLFKDFSQITYYEQAYDQVSVARTATTLTLRCQNKTFTACLPMCSPEDRALLDRMSTHDIAGAALMGDDWRLWPCGDNDSP